MSDTVVAAKLQVDATSAAVASKSVADLKDNVKQLQKEFENAKAGSVEQQTAYKNLKAAQDELSQSTKQLNVSSQDATEHFKNIKESLSGVASGSTSAGTGIKALSTEFKALLANPVVLAITAIIGVLALLYKSFTNTFEGGEKMEQVFAGIKAAASAVLDAIFNLGGAIIKFFSGDFSGAFKQAKQAVTGVVDAVVDAYSQTARLTKQIQDLHKEQLANDLDQAKRQKDLAALRAQAYDESVPIAKRKAALLQLQKDSEQNAKDDLDLAKRTADAKIALLSIGTDAAKKNQDEINKIRIEQIQGETENANELRNIGRQVTQAERQEAAERKAAADKAAAEQKARREQLAAFNTQLRTLQQANTLAQIKDGYAKEQAALEDKIKNDAAILKQQFEDKKITRDQYAQLEAAQQISADLARDALTEKHNQDVAAKETSFQKELAEIKQKTQLAGIVDQRQLEAKQLEITHEQQIAKAIADYKGDADKLFQIKQELDAQYKAAQEKLDEKNRKEDAKKKLQNSVDEAGGILNDPKSNLKAKINALNDEQKAVDEAFKNKTISEKEYNKTVANLAEARQAIRKKEQQEQQQAADNISDTLSGISEAIGQSTAAGKAFAIAAATIKALQTEITIIAGLSEVGPFGFIAGIAAAAGVAVGLFNTIKKIEKVDVSGTGSGSSGSSGITSPTAPAVPAAPVAPVQRSTTLDQASINNIGNAAAGGVNGGVRAYVVNADVQNAADQNARLEQASRLGGN